VKERIVIHVKKVSAGKWSVSNGRNVEGSYTRQADAVQAGRGMLEGAERGELHVYNEDGTIVSEFTRSESRPRESSRKSRPSEAGKKRAKKGQGSSNRARGKAVKARASR
jgi:hypothetical protein